MTQPNYLSWDNFKATVMVAGESRVHRITNTPRIDVFSDGALNRIGLAMEIAPDAVLPPSISRLAFVETRLFTSDGRHVIEVSTRKRALYHEFYHLAAAAAERVVIRFQDPVEALSAELSAFEALLETRPQFGIEREIGLLGELLFLQELISKHGAAMLDSWIGPAGEPHDFRVGTNEYEVKTTLSPHRIHTVNGPEQLVPSDGCDLFLVSNLLGPPGSGIGFSLSGTVTALADTFASSHEQTAKLETLLVSCDLSVADAAQYTRSFLWRRPIAIVPVDSTFPSITRPTIQHALGSLATRVDSFRYDVNVEGLEHEQGTAGFEGAMNSHRAK